MEKIFISLSGLKKMLSPRKLKNVTGGSGSWEDCTGKDYTCWCNSRNIGTAASRDCCNALCALCTWCE